jgi:hypothetical protein
LLSATATTTANNAKRGERPRDNMRDTRASVVLTTSRGPAAVALSIRAKSDAQRQIAAAISTELRLTTPLRNSTSGVIARNTPAVAHCLPPSRAEANADARNAAHSNALHTRMRYTPVSLLNARDGKPTTA